MKTFALFLVLLFPALACAMPEAEFQKLLASSPVLQEADRLLNQTWKKVSAHLSKKDRKTLLASQQEWIKSGRDETAREYLDAGYGRACAYAIATIRWVKNLEVYEYNYSLSEEDLGRAKADDAFWDEDGDIPAECRKK